MKYQINDPSTPDLFVDIVPTISSPNFPFTIKGCNGEDQEAINCKTSLDIAINDLSTFLPILKWAATSNLEIYPKAGRDFNAFYDRKSLKFFFKENPITKQMVCAANSSEVVTHELGHGVLDACRPDFWNTQGLEVWAIHEGYSDITAINTIMHSDLALEKALKETNGNLRLSNVLSRLAEEMGDAIYHSQGNREDNLNGLRNAINDFVFKAPEDLPSWAPDDQLSSECHSFGRLITGVWYEILIEIYEKEVANGLSKMDALKKARDFSFTCFAKAILTIPATVRLHEALAKSMLAIDAAEGSKYHDIMNKVFVKRKILSPVIKSLTQTSKKDMTNQIEKGITTKIGQTEVVVINEIRTLKLSDHITEPNNIKAMFIKGYDLSSCEIEVAAGKYYEFDQFGNLIHEIVPTDEEIIKAAQMCVTSIESIGPGPDTMWEVTNNKLLRTFIS
jgi:hypothetical protein